MDRLSVRRWLVVAVVVVACRSEYFDPEPPDTFDGVRYSARVESVAYPGGRAISLVVTLTNTGSSHQVRTYPVSCPVRLRLYRLADNALLFDETRRPCPSAATATIEIDGLTSRTLQSGPRTINGLAGDSIARQQSYGVRAVVNTEGNREVLIHAGVVEF